MAPGPQLPPPAASASTVVRTAAALDPAGAVKALAPSGETVVDPAVTFRIELSIGSADARLVLLDGTDALVAASGAQEVGVTTRLTLAPSVPLDPGRRYTLRLDGAVTRELHDADGRAFAPVALALRAAGQPPTAPDPKPKAKRSKR